ncbi:hypothetical protein C0J52_23237 [Blattella germanica]|nr:hypothetical protein C0J52_23237 [Blattella germanica]
MCQILRTTVFCLLAAASVSAAPSYYPYAGAVHPYAAATHPVPVHDTPEVAAAKAAHFAAYSHAAAAAAAAPDHGHYDGAYSNPHGHYAGAYSNPHGHYVGPLAGVPVIVNGVPADTPEVAHARAAHLAAHAAVAHGVYAAPHGAHWG